MPAPFVANRTRLLPISLGQAVGVGCGVLGVTLNSHLIPPDVLGTYGVFLTFAPIGMWVVHAGLIKYVARHWAAAPDRHRLLLGVGRGWLRRLGWLAVLALLAALAMKSAGSLPRPGLALTLFSAAALLSANSIAQTALQAEAAHWRDLAVTLATSLSRTFLPPLLFIAAGSLPAALPWGFVLHGAIAALAGAWALGRYWPGAAGTAEPGGQIAPAYDGMLFTLVAAANWLLAGMNRWIVTGAFGVTEGGYFTLAGGAATVVASTVGTVFAQYFQPGTFALADRDGGAREALARRTDAIAFGYGIAALGLVFLFSLVAPWLVGPLISPKYRDALHWIVPAGAFTIATITTVFYHTLLLAGRRESACGPVELTAAACLVGGSLIAAAAGREWFSRWLTITPLVTWTLTRSLARHYFFRPDAVRARAPVP